MKLNPDYEVGDVVELHCQPGGSPLPYGLGDGFQVRVIAIETNHGVVERDGHEWRVASGNIQARRPHRLAGAVVSAPSRCRR